ncbi:MAG: flagellar basal body-associated FliL family protein [Terasakiella sp.]|uniref:flagellar basal body-associated FliL family protein n=2 Tax=Terasakiella TaxID=196080 RepID=UPI003B002EEE
MKKAILFLVLLVVVAGATVGALYFLKLGPFEPKEAPQKTPEQIELEKKTTTTTVAIKPFTIPMFQGERVAGSIQVQFALEVALGQEEVVKAKMVRLEDAYLRDLYVFMPRLLRNKDKLDIAALKKRLKRITYKVLGEEDSKVVSDVLIQSVADNPG